MRFVCGVMVWSCRSHVEAIEKYAGNDVQYKDEAIREKKEILSKRTRE